MLEEINNAPTPKPSKGPPPPDIPPKPIAATIEETKTEQEELTSMQPQLVVGPNVDPSNLPTPAKCQPPSPLVEITERDSLIQLES